MTHFHNTIVALTVATATLPFPEPVPEDATQLAGIGMFVAEHRDGHWTFEVRVSVTAIDRGERPLLVWATSAMPQSGLVIGWQLADAAVAPLLAASKDADAPVAHAFLERFSSLVTGGSDDLAVDHGGAGAPPFAEHAVALGLPVVPIAVEDVAAAWQSGQMAPVHDQLVAETVALMDRWLLQAGEPYAEARVALGRWLADHRARGGRP